MRAIQDGKSLRDFTADLKPILQREGWWGRQDMTDPLTGETKTVQLGSPRRLQTIYDVKLRTAYSVGRYQRAQRSKSVLPYLVYRSMRDARVRPLHRAWNGTVLPQDHPWWDTHYPPNGWRCRCIAYPLSEQDAAAYPGAQRDDPSTETIQWTNPRTGEVRAVPVGIDPGFDYHPGKAAQAHLDRLLAEKQATFTRAVGQNGASSQPIGCNFRPAERFEKIMERGDRGTRVDEPRGSGRVVMRVNVRGEWPKKAIQQGNADKVNWRFRSRSNRLGDEERWKGSESCGAFSAH